MTFTANKTGRDLLIAIAEALTPTGADAPQAVYHYADVGDKQMQFPNVEVTPPEGDIDSAAEGDISSVLTYWVIATVSSASPDQTDSECEAYATALVNAYAYQEGYVGANPYRLTTSKLSYSPPYVDDTGRQSRSVGISVMVEFHE